MQLSVQTSVIVAGALIAVAIALTNHWEFTSRDGASYRLNRWTGSITLCAPHGHVAAGMDFACTPVPSS